ncbi:hypothetical protein AB1Y20_011040 [Prymnesium parvum]|uniref:R3H domain-containing protein n=1 Tax=Prymnesium parvum TaxID=97485 RepID=A0AB34IM44_PRYPA
MAVVGTKSFERTLLRLHAEAEADLPPPILHTHPLARVASASPHLHLSWSQLHPSLHPQWLAKSENIRDARVRPAQHERTALRAERKARQVESLASLVAMLTAGRGAHIVDFAGGTGPLALPLAALLPWCVVTIVDVKRQSLALAETRAKQAGLQNVRLWLGDIKDFDQPFSVGMALHACGEATDLAMDVCIAASARFVLCPCCVGKLSRSASDPYKPNGTDSRVSYPRSAAVASCVSSEEYDALACAGDFADSEQVSGRRGALRRLCKAWLEHDRMLYAVERGYDCRVCRMHVEDASPKNHILFGWPRGQPPAEAVVSAMGHERADPTLASTTQLHQCVACDAEALAGVAGKAQSVLCGTGLLGTALATSEWSQTELDEMHSRLRRFKESAGAEGDHLVVSSSSSRQRRLVHWVAEFEGLLHRTEGKRNVVVKRP